jgi:phosphotransferase system enzyme I (PtsI)
MNPQAIPQVKNAIRSISTADMRGFLEQVMQLTTPEAVQELLERTFESVVSTIEPMQEEQ